MAAGANETEGKGALQKRAVMTGLEAAMQASIIENDTAAGKEYEVANAKVPHGNVMEDYIEMPDSKTIAGFGIGKKSE
jgi:hypothetical protein